MNSTTTASLPDTSNVDNEMINSRIAITAVIFLVGVSMLLSLLLVVAIGLPLVRVPKKRTRAASFNLYLVFLSIADLLLSGCALYRWQLFFRVQWDGTEDQNEILERITDSMSIWVLGISMWLCIAMLAWVVAFVCHEILVLLRNSKQGKHCKPPTLQKVTVHGMVAFAFGVINYVLFSLKWKWAFFSIVLPATYGPGLYSFWVAFRVWKEGLMTVDASIGNRLRALAVYFKRIILVYCALGGCLLTMVTLSLLGMKGFNFGMVTYVNSVLWAVQGIASFALILTKPDVMKMVLDLLVGKACRRDQTGFYNSTTTFSVRRQSRFSFPKSEENSNETFSSNMKDEPFGSEDREAVEHQEENKNGYITSKFIEGIVDYRSDGDEDGDEEANGVGVGDEEAD